MSLEHDLAPFLAGLAGHGSTRALERSPLFARLRPEVERLLARVVHQDLRGEPPPPAPAIRATAWNVERGSELEGIAAVLAGHPDLAASDLFLLTELDHGMARSGNRDVARDLAKALELEYAFAPCYLSLVKGSGLEARAAGDNTTALHGNAIFSRHRLLDPHALALPNGIDLMAGREKRLGAQRAVIATVDHPRGRFRAVSIHLDAHSTQRHRAGQMRLILDHLEGLRPVLPVLLGGDWNTSTYDSSSALRSILGYWRRLLMGPGRVIRDHYPHPDRWFERHLFRQLDRRGYAWRELNAPGACTFHYDVSSLALNSNLGDWIPAWCFWWIRQALRAHGGRCSLKLDWFAGRGLRPAAAARPPRVAGDVHRPRPLSDHDPIVLDFALAG